MEHLWSPWRMKYIRRKRKPGGCVFCDAVTINDDDTSQVIVRGQFAYVILNKYPYTSGHILVVPYAHVDSFEKINPDAYAEIMLLIRNSIETINAVYQPDGYNLGANLGKVAGAGIADHIHFHIVPRWDGDTNYMTAVGGTRVLPEELDETHKKLKAAWPKGEKQA